MSRTFAALAAAALMWTQALAGETEISAAQSVIAGQIRAFLADDDAGAYGFAAPNIKRLFPSVDRFMAMVKGGTSRCGSRRTSPSAARTRPALA